jgi:hypothetical protein
MDYYEIKEREVNDIRQNSKQRGKKTDISYIQKDDHRRVTYYKRANSLVLSVRSKQSTFSKKVKEKKFSQKKVGPFLSFINNTISFSGCNVGPHGT